MSSPNTPPSTQYDEIMKALELVDEFLEHSEENHEFESTDDPDRPFRMEYAFEAETESHSKYRKNVVDS